MKIKPVFILCVLILFTIQLYAQKPEIRTISTARSESHYDIKHLTFNLNVSDTTVYIKGNVSTTAMVTVGSMKAYVFELNSAMTIDSAKINGRPLKVITDGVVRTIKLPKALQRGKFFTAQIFYHGMPPQGSGFFNGVTKDTSVHGTPMMYTISDPWAAADWWPVKQDVDDKADSVDMFITVPAGQADGSNGLLVNIDTSVPGYKTYHWQTHYPIAYYLVSMAVSKYAEEKYYHHFAGSNDSMLIQNFFMDTATFYTLHKATFDSIGMIIDLYSGLYGRYPFSKEKYGVCFTTLDGGMEHQTMTTIGSTNIGVIAHELAHQWFGDNVSYATWRDVWLSEGFATYSEQLFCEKFSGPSATTALRKSYLRTVLHDSCGEVCETDTTNGWALFAFSRVYAKGGGVVTMLRYMAPDDSLFFVGLRAFQKKYALGNARTSDLKEIMEKTYGMQLDTFFNEWIYGSGYPIYKVSWNQVGDEVYVKVVQTQSCPAITNHFSTYLELKLRSDAGDSVVRVYNSMDTQLFTFKWLHPMEGIVLNPYAMTICAQKGMSIRDTTLGPVDVPNSPK